MNGAARMIALALCAIAAGTLALMSLKIEFPLIMFGAAVVGATGRFRRELTKAGEMRLALVVAVLFALRWMLLPAPGLGATRVRFVAVGILDYAYAYPIAQALLLWLVLLFFIRPRGALPYTLPLYPALVVVLAGTMPTRAFGAWQGPAYQGAALALALASGAYFCARAPLERNTGQRPSRARRNAYIAVSCVVLVFGWGLGVALHRHGMDLDMMVVQLLQNRVAVASPGYSGEGRLDHVNAIKSVNTNAVTLRVTSASMPGYLRGKAFDTFDGRRWASLADAVVVHPAANDSGPDGAARWFPLANGDADLSSGEMTVQRAASLHGAVFTRLESAQVSADLDELTVDAHRIVVAGQLEPGAPYTVKGDVSAGHAPDAAERAAMTDVPRDIDPRIRTVADEISRNCTRDEERVAAVVGYLHATCTYSLDPKRGTSDDPMTVFLFENRAGHCELFATAASLLLRCMGVPCRYVTGFVAIEQNAYGGYWTARNRDAHAWVEAYLAGSGWTTVEATPAAGLPHEEASRFAQMWDYVVHRAKSAAAAIRNMDARALAVAAGLWIVRSLPVLAPIAAAIVTWVLLRRWSARRRRAPELDDGPDTVALNRRLHAMDRATARRGLVRAANETIDRFADRIESATHTDIATWYRTYSKARYGGDAPAIRAVLERTANSPR